MSSVITAVPDVFTVREIALVAGAPTSQAMALVAAGTIGTVDGRFVSAGDAVRAVRILRGTTPPEEAGQLFRPPAPGRRSPGRALAASGALHATALGFLVFLTTLGVAAPAEQRAETLPRLVFLATPGPGGGGGGGGLRQPAPPPKAQMKGRSIQRSPVPPPRPITRRPPDPEPKVVPPPVRPEPVARPIEPPPAPGTRAPAPGRGTGRDSAGRHARSGGCACGCPERVRQPRLRFGKRRGNRTRPRHWRGHGGWHRSGLRWRHWRGALSTWQRHYCARTPPRSSARLHRRSAPPRAGRGRRSRDRRPLGWDSRRHQGAAGPEWGPESTRD